MVGRLCCLDGFLEERVSLLVLSNSVRLDDLVGSAYVPLRELAVREVPVANELMRQRARDTLDVEGELRVLQHREVTHLQDVPDVALVGRRGRVGLVPRLVASPPGELHQRRGTTD